MHGSRIVSGLTAVFAGMAALFAAFAVVYSPVFLAVAALFGAVAYFMWYHASGRFARRLYRSVERRAEPDAGPGGFGAGPREEWRPPRDGATAREAAGAGGQDARGARARGNATRQRVNRGQAGRQRARQQRRPGGRTGPTAREAYRTLGLDPGADESAVRDAYREKVKDVHPDAADGDEEAFKRITAAYERLTDE